MTDALNPIGGTVLCTANNTPNSQTFEYAATLGYINPITRNSRYRIFFKKRTTFLSN